MAKKKRVVYLLFHYPSITEAYIESEIRAVSHQYEVLVIAIDRNPQGITVYNQHSNFKLVHEDEEIEGEIKEFDPHVIHTHRLFMIPRLLPFCERTGIPFTVRSHAHDAIPSKDPRVADWMKQAPTVLQKAMSTKLCRGILAFPFTQKHLQNWGVEGDKIFGCYPVIDFDRFHNTTSNGDAVVNSGSYMPKKKMEDFLELGRRMPNQDFKLYALSSRMHNIETLKAKNLALGNPVRIMDPVQPEGMPHEWKQAQWMVYTADRALANVGWPVSIVEAQAAGVGVCMANIRPDLKDYVGDSGYLYDSLDQVEKIISEPFDDERRSLGYQQAKNPMSFSIEVCCSTYGMPDF